MNLILIWTFSALQIVLSALLAVAAAGLVHPQPHETAARGRSLFETVPAAVSHQSVVQTPTVYAAQPFAYAAPTQYGYTSPLAYAAPATYSNYAVATPTAYSSYPAGLTYANPPVYSNGQAVYTTY